MFNIAFYKTILEKAKLNNFVFGSYSDSYSKMILLRHDIDVSPSLALKMAKIEHHLGVRSTYFFMFRSPFYNLFSRANNEIVKEIISLGHYVGLHYDEGYYPKELNLQELIDQEINVLENNFNIKIDVVSFHQPSSKIIDNTISINQINTYDQKFFKNIKYLSDSNMSFKEDPIKLLEMKTFEKIQFLIHPIWWMIDGTTTEDKFINTIKLNFELEQKQIFKTERAYGQKKIIQVEKEK